MNRRLKHLAIGALIAASGIASQAVFANCQSEGPYEVRQCSKSTWFAAPPAGAGAVSTSWWAVGYGSRAGLSSGTNVSPEGSGFLPTPLPGVFSGVDSGTLDTAGVDLVDATTIAGIGAPPGSLCFSSRANWGSPGIDSCIDVNRTDTAGGGSSSVNDNYVNKYWDSAPDPNGYEYFNHQLDPPMGVLLTESTGQYFAAAFFASAAKAAPRQGNIDPGQYWMSSIGNGDAGPSGNNVVPWQTVPQPFHSTTLSDPNNTLSPRNVVMDWSTSPVRFIHDGSTRPCFQSDGTTPCTSLGNATGVGVMDQGALIHFEIESTPKDSIDPNNCGTAWTTVSGSRVDYPATSTSGSGIAPDSCVRLAMSFGKTPMTSFIAAPANAATRDINRLASQEGKLGDLGYSVASTGRAIGGALVSQNANLRAVSRERNSLRVQFDTNTELNVASFDVVGIDGKGGSKVIGTVACKQCTSGLSANYNELISGAKLQGAKKIQIVVQPSGVRSNTLDLK